MGAGFLNKKSQLFIALAMKTGLFSQVLLVGLALMPSTVQAVEQEKGVILKITIPVKAKTLSPSRLAAIRSESLRN